MLIRIYNVLTFHETHAFIKSTGILRQDTIYNDEN